TSGSETSQNGVYTYTAPGTYTIVFTVTDNDGATGTASLLRSVSIANNAPTITTFDVTCTTLSCNFDGLGQDTDGSIANYNWDFGGAGTFTSGDASATAGTFVYSTSGTYSVSLTVTDDLGATAMTSQSKSVSSSNIAPTVSSMTVDCTGMTCNFSGL